MRLAHHVLDLDQYSTPLPPKIPTKCIQRENLIDLGALYKLR